MSTSAIRILLGTAAVSMIVFGLERGEASMIFSRATRICMECIGLG
ncbi:MAG: thioredoxin [Selenomonadaceae bacterium]|nr:thioredoxin [Selenomonadaceae bacterium]